jgi:hypothetical protein
MARLVGDLASEVQKRPSGKLASAFEETDRNGPLARINFGLLSSSH